MASEAFPDFFVLVDSRKVAKVTDLKYDPTASQIAYVLKGIGSPHVVVHDDQYFLDCPWLFDGVSREEAIREAILRQIERVMEHQKPTHYDYAGYDHEGERARRKRERM